MATSKLGYLGLLGLSGVLGFVLDRPELDNLCFIRVVWPLRGTSKAKRLVTYCTGKDRYFF